MTLEATLHQLLQGPRFPEREFIPGGPTFKELYDLAAGLRRELAVTATPTVCLATEDRGLLAAALLAALSTRVTLLLPYGFSSRALTRMQELTGFSAAIGEGDGNLPQGTRVIQPRPASWQDSAADLEMDPERELLKIFTGGSTGTPQIWSKTATNMFGESLSLADHFQVGEADTIVATVPPYHIYGLLFSVLLPLVSGAMVCQETPSFPNEIIQAIEHRRATLLACIPPHYRALRDKELTGSLLRLAFSSAGMLDPEDNRAFHHNSGVGIVEVYGSTETGGIAHRNRSLDETSFTAFPPVAWTIKEERLCVRSPYLSPELALAEDGFFTTGDRVAPDSSTTFHLLGRVDTVAKVGGKRVDLEEVRGAIRQVPGVVDCLVTTLAEEGSRENRIVALVQTELENGEAIRKHLAATLEPYALPRLIKIVEQIPLQANGKIDRKAIHRILTT